MYTFDAEKVKNEIVQWIRDWFEVNGKGCSAVVAISGGKDSSVTAALCVEALGKDRVFGVLLPQGVQPDIDMSLLLVNTLGIGYTVVNIGSTVDALLKEIDEQLPAEITKQTRTNLPARIRMAATYAVSQSMNGRVANTCNLSEDWVGYSTRYGDAAGDFSPLAKLTVQEVRAVGTALGLPDQLVHKVPIDGLSGLTDEQNLGFTYEVLDRYIRTGEIDDPETKKLIDNKRRWNRFKLELMPCFQHDAPILADDIR
ncbi:MAG: NAD(+) synthase [Eubacterium sp.]|nr:NAD(+) synthase [Eubacterium sp.]